MIVIRETVHHTRTHQTKQLIHSRRTTSASVAYKGYVAITAVCSYPHVNTTVQAFTVALLYNGNSNLCGVTPPHTATSKQLLVKTVFNESKFVDLYSNELFFKKRV